MGQGRLSLDVKNGRQIVAIEKEGYQHLFQGLESVDQLPRFAISPTNLGPTRCHAIRSLASRSHSCKASAVSYWIPYPPLAEAQ